MKMMNTRNKKFPPGKRKSIIKDILDNQEKREKTRRSCRLQKRKWKID